MSSHCLPQAADADRDGQVSDTEFGTMINVATAAQKRSVAPEAASQFVIIPVLDSDSPPPSRPPRSRWVCSRRWTRTATAPSPTTSGWAASSPRLSPLWPLCKVSSGFMEHFKLLHLKKYYFREYKVVTKTFSLEHSCYFFLTTVSNLLFK